MLHLLDGKISFCNLGTTHSRYFLLTIMCFYLCILLFFGSYLCIQSNYLASYICVSRYFFHIDTHVSLYSRLIGPELQLNTWNKLDVMLSVEKQLTITVFTVYFYSNNSIIRKLQLSNALDFRCKPLVWETHSAGCVQVVSNGLNVRRKMMDGCVECRPLKVGTQLLAREVN